MDVDISKFPFKKLPFIETSIHCEAHCSDVVGFNSLYNYTKKGFRVYITTTDKDAELSVEDLKKNKWQFFWKALPTEWQ